MFKIFVLCVIISSIQGHPSYLPTAVAIPIYEHYAYEPTVVGHAVTHLPTAVSHQSQTILHEKHPYIRPVLDYQPAAAYVRAHYAPPHTKIGAAAQSLAYAPLTYGTELYPSGWKTGLSYTNGWNGWPVQ